MKSLDDNQFLLRSVIRALPNVTDTDIIKWGEQNIRLIGSTRSERFKVEITPWLRKAYEAVDNPDVDVITLVFNAQSGKSVFGEVLICYWIATKAAGDVQYNWENDEKGKQRWRKRVKKILDNCKAVVDLMPRNVSESTPMIAFDHLNFTMQGVHSRGKLESESITLQINEELHDWDPGRKRLADKRQEAVWDRLQANISTGGQIGDQLDTTWNESSQEKWEEPCDKCGKHQHFHARAVDDKLGGLRYETIRKDDGTYDWEAIEPTIYYECEHCGHRMVDDYELRRQRSFKGRYPESGFARHIGLHAEAVSVYWVKYIDIVREKLQAIAALRRGDKKPWIVYIQRSEGWFYDPRYRPHLEAIKLNNKIKKGEGLEGRKLRGMTVDKQRGKIRAGETPHYWVVIRDWISPLRSRLVWEGRLQTNEDIEELRIEYGVKSNHVLVDSGDDTVAVYHLCHEYGYCAIKGTSRESWTHLITEGGKKKKVQRIYSPIGEADPFHGTRRANMHKVDFLLYSKHAIRDRLESIRSLAGENFEIPNGVSKHYLEHMNSEEKEEMEMKDGSTKMVWVQQAKRNDLFVCECYQTLLVDLCDLQNLPEDEEEIETDSREDREDD